MLEFKNSLFPTQSYHMASEHYSTFFFFFTLVLFFFLEIRTFIQWKRAVSNLSFCFSTEESQMSLGFFFFVKNFHV